MNDDGKVKGEDLSALKAFVDGPSGSFPAPGPNCGRDPDPEDALGCHAFCE